MITEANRDLLNENIKLRGLLNGLCGFISTARRTNNPEWMHALCERVNKALAEVGDDDTITWDEKADWIYTKSEGKSG